MLVGEGRGEREVRRSPRRELELFLPTPALTLLAGLVALAALLIAALVFATPFAVTIALVALILLVRILIGIPIPLLSLILLSLLVGHRVSFARHTGRFALYVSGAFAN